jgi:hypothetical protein
MRSRTTIPLLIILLLLFGCSTDPALAPPAGEGPPAGAGKSRGRPGMPMGQYLHADFEAWGRQAFGQAYKLERAVRRFAADNEGFFPVSLGTPNAAGRTLRDYLPGGKLLWNIFTGVRSNPVFAEAASPGEVGYMAIMDPGGHPVGYTITAFGKDPGQFLVLQYVPPTPVGD